MLNQDEEMEDLYGIMGLSQDAPPEAIRKQYLKLSRELHPDKAKENKEAATKAFARMSNAYEILSNEEDRREYDSTYVPFKAGGAKSRASASNAEKSYSSEKSSHSTRNKYTSKPTGARRPSTASPKEKYHTHNQDNTKNDGNHWNYSTEGAYSSAYDSAKASQQGFGGWNDTYSTYNDYYNNYYNDHNGYYRSYHSNRGTGQHKSHDYEDFFGTNSRERTHSNTKSSNKQQQSQRNPRKSSFYSDDEQNYNPNGSDRYQSRSKADQSDEKHKSKKSHADSKSRKESSSSNSRPQGNGSSTSSTQNTKVFGICKTTDLPCQRCISQGGFCWQHQDQDPHSQPTSSWHDSKPKKERAHSRQSPSQHSNTTQTFGIRQDGQPCMRCCKKGGYCYQHVSQQPGGSSSNRGDYYDKTSNTSPFGQNTCKTTYDSSYARSAFSQTPFGVTQKGLPCKRCLQQGRFCHQHARQQQTR